MTRFALGRQPADPTKPKLRLRRSAVDRPTPPPSCDWLSEVSEWGMLANDEVGDCTMAGAAHTAMAVDHYGQGRSLVITDREVLDAYTAISGYNPADPNTDVGATLQDALDYWRKTGVAGNQIVAAAQLDAHDLDLVRACIATFGSVYTGMWITEAAMAQFGQGAAWTATGRSRSLGGHCVPLGAYDDGGFYAVSWGKIQPMSTEFYLKYFDEVWVPIDLDWLQAAGTSPAGMDIATLNSDFEALTGQPGPFPPMVVPPTPAPTPEPAPLPPYGPTIDADTELVRAFEAWRSAREL